jgi:autotransporter-associated beta strand protein
MKTSRLLHNSRIPFALASAIAAMLATQSVHAQAGTWNVDANGIWSLNTNWLSNTIANGGVATFTNDITADRTVSLDSARTITGLTFGDSNTATAGSWTINNNGNAANTLTGLTAITVNALGTGKTATISAVIAGSASRIELNGSGGGTLVLAGANTFNFTTNNANFGWRLNAGSTVVVASDSAFGVSTGTDFNASTLVNLNGGTLQASGSARTVANPIWLNGSTTVVSGSQSLTFSGAAMGRGNNATVTNNITGGGTLSFTGKVYTDQTTGSKILTFNGTGNTLISGNISNNTAGTNTAGAITKSGAGTLTLSGTNSYSGVTAVSDGTLLINGNSSLATGAVNVTGTGTLGGTGTTGGAISVATGGTLSPGASIESLKSGALTMASGSTFNYGIANASSTGADLLAANDTLSLSNVNLVFDLSTLAALSGSGFVNGDVLTLISYTGSGITSGFAGYADDTNYTFGSNVWKFNYNDTANGLNYASDLTGSNRVTLTAYNVVPEPNVAALLGGFGLLSLLRRRRNGAGVKS